MAKNALFGKGKEDQSNGAPYATELELIKVLEEIRTNRQSRLQVIRGEAIADRTEMRELIRTFRELSDEIV
ncbi:MAG: hypothetical protein B7X02_00275 [Rhodospirillales bacterium 12-54-5]|nr:MAG: hypothetical protein B7X02_00275 [Rhodospirillales bacterium 12-54-5]